jgi:phosphate transport system substrate-binding protein
LLLSAAENRRGNIEMKWKSRTAVAALVLMLCSGASPGSGKPALTGSSTIAPLAAEMGKRFETLNPGVRVEVQTGGSSRGVNDARSGLAAFSSRITASINWPSIA